jgi:hypothetical protein
MDSIQPHIMPSSPNPNGRFTSPELTSSFAEMCDCEDQREHWKSIGVPLENLPEICKRSMAILDNVPTSEIKGKLTSDGSQGSN